MKLPNGYGSVHKLSGTRRKPWRARISDGYVYDPETDKQKRVYKTLGYYETKAKALQALADYNANPYDIDTDNITFEELYNQWLKEYSKNTTPSYIRAIQASYGYCSELYKIRFKDIRVYHMKDIMDKGFIIVKNGKEAGKKRYASPSTKMRMKSMFNLVFDYACEHDITTTNYARLFNIDSETVKEKKKNEKPANPFTDAEVQKLWDNINTVPFVDMVLIGIYSGWRPQELSILKISDIDLDNNQMFGGMKTEAGLNRYVPIHPKIKPLIEARIKEARELKSDSLFNDFFSQTGYNMTYDKYRRKFEKIMKRLDMEHRPHDSRKTFITKAKHANMNEYLIKLIVGHTIADITERVYTKRTFEELYEEIKKIVD